MDGFELNLTKGRYQAHSLRGPDDLADARALRVLCFGPGEATTPDRFDEDAVQVLIRDYRSGQLVCTYRLREYRADQVSSSYAAQFYGLERLSQYEGVMLELGRFCIHPDLKDPDVLRFAWAVVTGLVDERGVQMLFGCSSFWGTDAQRYRDAFGLLKARHLAPGQWQPQIKAPEVYRYADEVTGRPNAQKAQASMPPLLRTYLLMGGWVSDHAVIDRGLGTLHVFTGLEIGTIPEPRKRLLRALV
ncbi:MAG: GNAT family N-acetyltransferase [Sulfitobacter sp.]